VPKENIKGYVDLYNRCHTNDGQKIIPNEILNGNDKIRQWFFNGYCAANCTNEKTKSITCDTKGKTSAAHLYYFLQSIGFNCSINYRSDKKDVYTITASLLKQTKNPLAIKKIGKFSNTNEYVYDIETDSGYFQAGIGNMIVHNTDSIFCNFDTTMHESMINKIAYSMIVGAYVSEKITDYLRSFNKFKNDSEKWTELEYEKVYGNLLLFTKKRYTGTLFEFNPLKYKYIDKKGIALKRRDYCPLVKDVYAGSLKILFDESIGTPDKRILKAEKLVLEMIEDLLKGNVEPEKLILSKSLRDHYKIRDKKKKKNNKENTFNPNNIHLNDNLIINHPVLGKTEGLLIKKDEIKMEDFFSKTKKKKYPLQLRIESCENDDLLYEIDEKYKDRDYKGLPFHYEDILLRKGFQISLKKIINPKTTEAELEPVTQAHVRLTRRMYIRDPGSAPVSGERVPFMFVEKKGDVLQHEKAEHPDYVRLHKLKPDPKYYLDNQLRKPIEQLFALLIPDPERLFDPLIRKYKNKLSGQSEMTNFITYNKNNNPNKSKPKRKKKRKNQKENQISLEKWFSIKK
jgi:hypothetical protein